MVRLLLALACCLPAFGYPVAASAKAFYEVVGLRTRPHVSADGNVVLGSFSHRFGGPSYRWTLSRSGVTTEILPLDDLANVFRTNGDGSVIVGSLRFEAFRWTANGGTQLLGLVGGGGAQLDVSSDGSVVVGGTGREAVAWTEADGPQLLGILPGTGRSVAAAVAADGGVIVGWSGSLAFRWTPDAGMGELGTLPGGTGPGKAFGVSSRGDVVVGSSGFEPFRWTGADGMVGLGFLPGNNDSDALDVSSDGNRIVGRSQPRPAGRSEAFLWTPDGGMRSLEVVLAVDEGLDLGRLALLTATSISDDGLVITGVGQRGGSTVTWIADLRESPPQDAYQCYDVKTSGGSADFEAREASLSDRFGDTVQVVKKGKQLCAPVQVGAIGISNPEAYLLCYDLKHHRKHGNPPGSEPIDVRVSNELWDDQHLSVKRPKRLCVPSAVEHAESGAGPGSGELELDHFLCYGAKVGSHDSDPIKVSLADRFQTSERQLKKPKLFCNPVDKNGEGIFDPEMHLTCYEAKPRDEDRRLRDSKLHVVVSNQFGTKQRFTVKRPKTVCVPSLVEEDGR